MTHPEDLSLEQHVRLLSGAGFWRTRALPEAGVRSVIVSDGPHGMRAQLGSGDHLGVGESEPSTCFPPAVTLGSTWDPDLARRAGEAIGQEARDLGVAVVLGPGINIKRHPLGGRSFEYLSEDPVLTGELATAWVQGVQSKGVGTSLKHFAVNNQENHRFISSSVVDERTMRELYLRAFETVVRRAQPWTVMCAYNRVNGVPASENPWLLTQVLREEWGFEGLVVSDWGAVVDRAAGVAAGLDLEMPGGHGLNDKVVLDAVRRGSLSEDAVRTCGARILALVDRAPEDDAPGKVGSIEEHHALAREVAAAGTVLLTNDGTLPLAPTTKVAVIGAFAEQPRFQGAGSSKVNPTRVTTLLDALRERGVEASYTPGYSLPMTAVDRAQIEQAALAAAEADVAVVMVGLPGSFESEGFDRDHLRLPRQHDLLVEAVSATNPRTVVVLSNGAPVILPWSDQPAAIVEAYLGGQAGGAALADVLYGDAEPGGRLAESFPAAQSDVASDLFFPGVPRQVEYREGLSVGYRHHTTHDVAPAFAFGHGLSYTQFAWSDPAASATVLGVERGEVAPLTVEVTVTNTGERPGSDVVQVYRHDRTGVVTRPRRELVGFAKVHLEAGESQRVPVAIDTRAFSFWDCESGAWQVARGEHALEIARSSDDVHATLKVTVTAGAESSADSLPLLATSDADFAARLGHAIPQPIPARPFSWDSTPEELRATRGGRAVAALLLKIAKSAADGAEDGEGDEMVDRSLPQLPLRAYAWFAGGRMSRQTVDAFVAVSERGARGALSTARAAVRRKRSARRHG